MSKVHSYVHRPSSNLRRYVREILFVRSQYPRMLNLLPETTFTLVLRQSGLASLRSEVLPTAIISGLQQRNRIVEHGAQSSLVIVRFTEVGAAPLLRDRVDILYNQTVPLDAVVSRQKIEQIQNTLADIREIHQQVSVVERFLIGQIHVQNKISPQIEAAAQIIRKSEGRSLVSAIARHVAMSPSALERHFRATVGATPKMLCRLARLQHIFRLWDKGQNLTNIALEAGYCDQPHMVRDFRFFTGTSPEDFFRRNVPHNLPIFYK